MSLEQQTNPVDELDVGIEIVDSPDLEIDTDNEPQERSFSGESNNAPKAKANETVEEKRERRRLERRNSDERRKRAIMRENEHKANLERTVNELQSRLAQQEQAYQKLEGMAKTYQVETLNKEITENKNLINYFQQQHAEAVSAMDGVAATKAIALLRDAENKVNQLEQQKTQYAQQQTNQQAQFDPRMQIAVQQTNKNRERFQRDNPWFGDPNYEEETEITRALDNEVFMEGYAPNTPAYWNRLNERLKEELDYMFDEDTTTPQKVAKPAQRNVVGASVSQAPAATGQTKLKFSADKIPALKQLGILDDNNRIVDKKRALYYHKAWNKEGAR